MLLQKSLLPSHENNYQWEFYITLSKERCSAGLRYAPFAKKQ